MQQLDVYARNAETADIVRQVSRQPQEIAPATMGNRALRAVCTATRGPGAGHVRGVSAESKPRPPHEEMGAGEAAKKERGEAR